MAVQWRTRLALGIRGVLIAGCGGSAALTSPPTQLPTPLASATPAQHPTPPPSQVATASPRIQTAPPTLDITPTPEPTPTAGSVSWPPGVTPHAIGSEGNEVGSLEYLPVDYNYDDSPRPLLVYIHDTGETGDGSEADLQNILRQGLAKLIADGTWPAQHPFVVLMPQMPPNLANTHCVFGTGIDKFLDFAQSKYRIDPARMYLSGISCGAIAIWDFLAQARHNKVAAVVPIAGAPLPAIQSAGCDIASTPNWTFHGALDDLIPVDYVNQGFDELSACKDPKPADLKLTVYPDAGHDDSYDRTYDGSAGYDIYEWMLDHEVADSTDK